MACKPTTHDRSRLKTGRENKSVSLLKWAMSGRKLTAEEVRRVPVLMSSARLRDKRFERDLRYVVKIQVRLLSLETPLQHYWRARFYWLSREISELTSPRGRLRAPNSICWIRHHWRKGQLQTNIGPLRWRTSIWAVTSETSN
jgi:hypothetical protein